MSFHSGPLKLYVIVIFPPVLRINHDLSLETLATSLLINGRSSRLAPARLPLRPTSEHTENRLLQPSQQISLDPELHESLVAGGHHLEEGQEEGGRR